MPRLVSHLVPRLTPDSYSDLWHGDEARDWAGHELDCCVEARPEDRERWADQATLLRVEASNKARLARAAWDRAAAISRSRSRSRSGSSSGSGRNTT
jgi:hypothetical protein